MTYMVQNKTNSLSIYQPNGNKPFLKMKKNDKIVKKTDLPEKICPVCNRPFAWRKKWEKNWESVVYCSDACRAKKPKQG
jgi:hypothetical protein